MIDAATDDPQDDGARIKANAQKLVAGGASSAEIDAYLAHEAAIAQVGRSHADYHSGALQKRNAILNANDVGRAQDAATADTFGDRMGSLAERHATELGGGMLLRGLRSWITGEDAATAGQNVANDVQEAGQNEPGVNLPKAIPLIGGARVTLPDLLAGAVAPRALIKAGVGPMAAGGLAAGVPTAMAPQPESAMERAVSTVKATGLGMAVPAVAKTSEYVNTVRGASNAPTLDANLVARGGAPGVSGGARGAAASPLYDQFRAQPDLPMTPDLDRLLKLPLVRRALRTVQGESADLNGLPATNPGVLDAIVKRVGNKAWTAQQGFEAGTTNDALKAAIDEAANQAGGVPLSPAVNTYAEHSNLMDAVGRGNRAMQYAASPKGAPLGAIEDSPAAFRAWLEQEDRSPDELQAATEGINSRLKVEPKTAKFGIGKLSVPVGPSRAMTEAPGLLRATQGGSALERALDAITTDNSPNVTDWVRSRFSRSAPDGTSQGGSPLP